MSCPPTAQIGRRIGAAKPRTPTELLRQASDRKRRTVGGAMQVDSRRFTGFGQPANEAGMQRGELVARARHSIERPLSVLLDEVRSSIDYYRNLRFEAPNNECSVRSMRQVSSTPLKSSGRA